MTNPYLKYYLRKNKNFGIKKPEFIPPTKEEYEEYLQTDSGGINALVGHIRPYELYVERHRQHHERIETELEIYYLECGFDDDQRIKNIEESEDFIKWIDNQK